MNDNQLVMIKQAWLEVFPNSNGYTRSVLGASSFSGRLYKDASECTNRILDNDPLHYTAWVDGNDYKEWGVSLLIAPPVGSNLCFESARLRKKTIKNFDHDKLVKRFKEIRSFISSHADNMKHDITGKLGR